MEQGSHHNEPFLGRVFGSAKFLPSEAEFRNLFADKVYTSVAPRCFVSLESFAGIDMCSR